MLDFAKLREERITLAEGLARGLLVRSSYLRQQAAIRPDGALYVYLYPRPVRDEGGFVTDEDSAELVVVWFELEPVTFSTVRQMLDLPRSIVATGPAWGAA